MSGSFAACKIIRVNRWMLWNAVVVGLVLVFLPLQCTCPTTHLRVHFVCCCAQATIMVSAKREKVLANVSIAVRFAFAAGHILCTC